MIINECKLRGFKFVSFADKKNFNYKYGLNMNETWRITIVNDEVVIFYEINCFYSNKTQLFFS